MRGQHLDHFALDQGGVDVHDDQALGTTVKAGRLNRDVVADAGRLGGQPLSEHQLVGPGHVELDGCHGVGGEPLDVLDVAATLGDGPGNARHGVWSQG